MEALGLIETKGFTGSIIAADTALKSADVTLLNAEKIKGGYVTVQLEGSVGAVKAAVEAATEATQPLGTLISSHVIPRMHEEARPLIVRKKNEQPLHDFSDVTQGTKQTETSKKSNAAIKENEEAKKEHPVQEDERKVKDASKETVTEERQKLEVMTVPELRKRIREENAIKDDSSKMKNAKKEDLINILLNNAH